MPKRGARAGKARRNTDRGNRTVRKGDADFAQHPTASARTGAPSSRGQRPEGLSSVTEGPRPALASKYAQLTVYDPATRTVEQADGSRVALAAPPTLAELSAMPGPLNALDRAYVCEEADDVTIQMLAATAGITVGALEAKRHDWRPRPTACARDVPENRRRCWRCPLWTLTNDPAPF